MNRIGKDIAAMCTKCKMLLTHVVVSEVDGTVSKVQCRTCGSLHRFRDGQKKQVKRERTGSGSKLIKSSRAAAAKAPASEQLRIWQMKKEALEEDPEIRDYRPDQAFEANEIVQHSKFGLGFVQRVVSSNRVEILFQDGLKLMAMNTI